MSDPTSYAMPAVGSIWEWQPGNPMAREVVTVTAADAVSVHFSGPSGDRAVNLADFAAEAIAAPLRHRK